MAAKEEPSEAPGEAEAAESTHAGEEPGRDHRPGEPDPARLVRILPIQPSERPERAGWLAETTPEGDVEETGETTRLWVESGGQPTVAEPMVCEAGVVQSGTWLLQLRLVSKRPHRPESRMRENRPSGLEGGVAARAAIPTPIKTWRFATRWEIAKRLGVRRPCAALERDSSPVWVITR